MRRDNDVKGREKENEEGIIETRESKLGRRGIREEKRKEEKTREKEENIRR